MSARSAARWPDPGAGRTRLLPALARGRGPLMELRVDRGEPGAEELSRLLALEPWRACALRGLGQLLLQAQLHVGGVPLRPRPGVDRPAVQIPAEILRRRRELRGGQLRHLQADVGGGLRAAPRVAAGTRCLAGYGEPVLVGGRDAAVRHGPRLHGADRMTA